MSANETTNQKIILSFDRQRVWNNALPRSTEEAIMFYDADSVWLGNSGTGIPVARYREGMIWVGAEIGSARCFDIRYDYSKSYPKNNSKNAITSLVKVLSQRGEIKIENKKTKGSLWRGEEIHGEPFARYNQSRAWLGGAVKNTENADACSYVFEIWYGSNETGVPVASLEKRYGEGIYGPGSTYYFKSGDSTIYIDGGRVWIMCEGKGSETIARYDTEGIGGVASAVVLLLSEMQKEQEEYEAERQHEEDIKASVILGGFKLVAFVLIAWLWGKVYPAGVSETSYIMGAISFSAVLYFFNFIRTFPFIISFILIPIIGAGVSSYLHDSFGSYFAGLAVIVFGICWVLSWLGSFSGGGGGSSSDVTVTIKKDKDSKVNVRVRNRK